jgi:dienelactone hydrolase
MSTTRHLAGVCILVLLAACGGSTTTSEPATTPTVTAPLIRPFAVEQWTETFVDPSRPTEEGTETPALPERTLDTAVYLPDTGGATPLIVFAHGLNGHPDKFTELLSAWAEAGYIVAAPAFPTTNNTVPGGGRNYATATGQPADVSFVIDEMVRASAATDHRLSDRIDIDRIAVAGMSLGGATAYGTVFSTCCRDARVRSAAVFAGALLPLAGDVDLDGHVPLLIVHGQDDPALVLSNAEDAFAASAPPTWFVTLLGGGHSEPFENTASPHDELVVELTVAWWDATLGGDGAAFSRLQEVAGSHPLATVVVRR